MRYAIFLMDIDIILRANPTFDKANQLWVLNADGLLAVYSVNRELFKRLRTYREAYPIINFFAVNHQLFFTTANDQLFIYALAEGDKNHLWIGCVNYAPDMY